jgi:electron-transferring-flavoprotein dehydrogenase
MDELFPNEDWMKSFQETQRTNVTPVNDDEFLLLSETGSFKVPHFLLPSQLHNEGNYIISLSQLCRWLGTKAEEMGVEIYAGFSASEVIYDGLGKDGKPKATFERGMELHARQTLFAEGARGSCTENVIQKFDLRNGKQEQTYALGIKEVWEIPEKNHQPGLVQHTIGWPLQTTISDKVFGGSFLYHQAPNLVLIGLVVGLDYANPYLNPYQEFQRWKTHPNIRKHLEGGTCLSYGARVLNEGGYHAIPKLTFPGGAIVGCSAGFVNAVKIKGSHTALKSGMLAAEAAFDVLKDGEAVAEMGDIKNSKQDEILQYEKSMHSSWIRDELYQVRNCRQAFSKWGVVGGLVYSGIATHVTKGREPWTLVHTETDSSMTEPAMKFESIKYPPPDGTLTFDLLTNLQRSGTYHAEDQPSHLRIKESLSHVPQSISMQVYGAPEQRFCPAGVYEYFQKEGGDPELVINAQNCIHCKCCSIKMPSEYIEWTVPEGGGGPQYQIM